MRRFGLISCVVAVFSVFVVQFVPCALGETTYYVDQNYPGAADGNPGTEEMPWKTIERAANVAMAGDTVVVKTGIYQERVVPRNSGTPESPITFKAFPRRTVVMWGFDTVSSHHLRIEGFAITHSLTGWAERYGVLVRSNGVEVVDNYFYDLKAAAIQGYWKEPAPCAVYVSDNQISRCQMGIVANGEDWVIENNEVERLYRHGEGDCDYARFFGNHIVFRNNWFHGTLKEEVGSSNVDCFQTFDHNRQHTHHVTIENNRCLGFFDRGVMLSSCKYPSEQYVSDITIRNNVFAHGEDWGVCVGQGVEDGGVPHVTVVHNVFADIEQHGVAFRGKNGQYGVVRNNIFYHTGTSYEATHGAEVSGDHNLILGAPDPSEGGLSDVVGADPLFIDPAGDDFELQGDSPAIDAGALLSDVGTDLMGTPRPQGAESDIGAYEYVDSSNLADDPTCTCFVSVDGSDGNPGSAEKPWRTIQYAADIAQPGDIICVTEGSYDERVRVGRSGTSDLPITFRASGRVATCGFSIMADHIRVSGFDVSGTNTGHWREGAGIFVVGKYCEIEGNSIHEVTRTGILLHASEPDSPSTSHCIVRGNRIERAGLSGITVLGRHHLIEDNDISHTLQYPATWADPPATVDADGIRFFGSGHIIRRNHIHDILLTDPENIDPHIDCFQTWGPAYQITFEENICDNPNDRMQGFMISEINPPVSDLTIRNNVIRAFRLVNVYGCEDITIVHNSFQGDLSYTGESGYGIELHDSPGARIENNLFYDVGRHKYPYLWYDSGSAPGLQVGYNGVYMSDGHPPAGTPQPFDLWQIDPKVLDAAGGDFRLLPDSPAIDAGCSLVEVTADLEGIPRPQGAGYDIGAYEAR